MDHHASAALTVVQAWAQGDVDTALRIAHSVRGVAGNIGLTRLAQAAAALETALRDRQDTTGLLAKFAAETAAATEALRNGLQRAPPRSTPGAANVRHALQHAARLANLLADSDGEAVDYLLEHGESLRALFAPTTFTVFDTAVRGFDFERAQHLLQTARATTPED